MTVTQPTLKVQVRTIGDPTWYSNALRLETLPEACRYAVDLFARWGMVETWRVVDETGDVKAEQL